MRFCLIYITTKNQDEAVSIGKMLVQSRLAACINIINGVQSIFWWDGKIQNESECIIIAKSKTNLINEIIDKIKATHSYENPCIIAIPVLTGQKNYLEWIKSETINM